MKTIEICLTFRMPNILQTIYHRKSPSKSPSYIIVYYSSASKSSTSLHRLKPLLLPSVEHHFLNQQHKRSLGKPLTGSYTRVASTLTEKCFLQADLCSLYYAILAICKNIEYHNMPKYHRYEHVWTYYEQIS